MESSTLNKDQEIAGSASALFGDSSGPYDALFASDTSQTLTQQDNQSAASFFDSLSNEQPSEIQQTTTDYYGYPQEGTYGTVANTTDAQQYNSATGYVYDNYYGGQYDSTNTNGTTEEINNNSSVDPTTNYSYDYTGYSYDASYANGQDYSQYYDYSQQQQYQQQQHYDPNSGYYYYDQSAYYQSDETNFQNYTQDSISIEQQQQQQQGVSPDQTNSNQYEEKKEDGKDVLNNNNVEEVDKSMYDESKQEISDALKPVTELSNVSLIPDVNNSENNDNEIREFSSDSNKDTSREIKFSTQTNSIENQDTTSTFEIQDDLNISSSNNLTSLNNEDVAAVALVETIETNQENPQFSAETENDFSIEKNDELNGLENEDQEVNIIHKDDRDIFEYQPQEIESQPKSELSQVEPPISPLIDESKIVSEISEKEEINDKSKDEFTKLDDLDDLVLGSTSKVGSSDVLAYTELEGATNTQERSSVSVQDNDSISPNFSSYQYDYSGQNYQYNEQWVSNDSNYQYQEYDTNKTTESNGHVNYQYDTNQPAVDSTAKNEQSTYQYSNGVDDAGINQANLQYSTYDPNQTMVENSSSAYQNNYHYSGYEANSPAVVNETDQSNYQYQGYNTGVAEQEQLNYQYQVYETGQTTVDNKDVTDQANYQYTGYDTNQFNYQSSTDQTNYQYQEYETSKADANAGTGQSNYQYYQGYQSTVNSHQPQNSSPPMSPSSKRSSLISCPDIQCRGENKATAKFCSDCGKPINNVINTTTPTVNVSEVTGNTSLYNNNLNTYSGQSLPYNNSQASYSASSFSSYGNRSTPVNDAGVLLDTHQLGQQQYYGSDESNAINDPLGRSKGCRPVVAFGFGGKLYTMFPKTVQRFTSTDQSTPITKSAPSAFTVRFLKEIIPMSDIDSFPGPLLMDNDKGGVKAKKKNVLKYLNDQIQALEGSISSLDESVEKKKSEDILIIWNLFKIMFENDGTLIGSPKVEELVRKILVPSASKSDNDEANFTVPADTSFNAQNGLSETLETSSLTYSVSTNAVDILQELLLKGDRVAAIRHAMNENLWAHALIIASCVNKDLWKEVVTGFVKHEMGTQKGDVSESNGRESLRVLYSLFAGQGKSAIKEFLPYSNLLNVQSSVTAMIPTSHYSPNPNAPYVTSNNVPPDSLLKWKETVAMILANRASGDNQAISALGDVLKEYGWIYAAHVCYMLSPNVSIISGFDAPNVRLTLLGNDYTHNLPIDNFFDWQSLHMTEIYEFGLSLKNNDSGLPHLQAYKLLYAWWLADCGYLNEARRYCESIANTVKVYTKGSPYFHGCFLEKLKGLTERLLEHGGNSSGTHESSSWLFAKKMPKAALDSLWGSLEVKFNKFVAGDVVDENVERTLSSTPENVGPFSHFSSVTYSTSEVPSRSVSASDFRSTPNTIAADTRRATTPNVKQLNVDHRRSSTPGVGAHPGLINGGGYNTYSPTISESQNTMSSVPEGVSLESSPTDNKNGYYGHFGGQDQQYSAGSYMYNYYDNNQQSTQSGYNSSMSDHSNAEANNKQKQQTAHQYYQPSGNTYKNDSAWWNNPNADSATVEDQQIDKTHDDVGGGEFISLMDNNNFASFVSTPAPVATSVTDTSNNNNNLDDGYDDLGLGNNSFGSKKKDNEPSDSAADTDNNNEETKHDTSQTEPKKEEKQEEQKEEKKGWFGKLWFGGKKEGSKTANLGEESSFYFDPVQKRWINKKAGAETSNTLTPLAPPPQRSKTTSPLPSPSMMSSNPNRQSLPPVDNKGLTGPPTSATPPPQNKGGRASSASMRRNVRSRYVDIMNQPSSN